MKPPSFVSGYAIGFCLRKILDIPMAKTKAAHAIEVYVLKCGMSGNWSVPTMAKLIKMLSEMTTPVAMYMPVLKP